MKILCVIDSLNSGGAQRQLVELALGFKEDGHCVSFLIYHNIPFYNPILECNGISITCIHETNYIKRLYKMRMFIRRGNYDAVLAFLEASSFICEIAGIPFRKWKLIVGERNANPNILKSYKLKLFRWFHIFADYIVANSNANISLIRKINPFLSVLKYKVIYNAVDFTRWKPVDNYIYRNSGKIKLLVVARQYYQKNLNGLVDALILLNDVDRKKISIEWYGASILEPFIDNSFKEAFAKIKANKLEKVISFHPATHDITKIIQQSDAVGLFSFYEGFPNSVCEAMACGKPVICSAVSDIPKILTYDSNMLCDPTKPQSIKQAICYLINLSDEQLNLIGMNNLKIAKVFFAREKIISAYLQLIAR